MDEGYLDSPMETDDVFPCKGCGDILEEGKAFELAGNRWHLDCFRCNTCGTLLDSDANLLLLGDGSLICNNCTYSCSACGNKIEDLAILTGDQAFCATCFRCRNCKRKIENLRYARTSQGIFCMSCHESLMARRRKKNKAAQQAKSREKDSPMITDKSLPALPPNAIPPNAFSEDKVAPDDDEGPTELSPRPRPNYPKNDDSSRSSSRPARSPERQPDSSKEGGLGLPAPNYRNNRNSAMYAPAELPGDNGDSFFIPLALDPSPAPTATPRSATDTLGTDGGNKRGKDQDYFGPASSTTKNDSQASTPHIAFQAQQDKQRQPSSEYEAPVKAPQRKLSKRNKDARAPPPVGQENRKLSNGRIDDFKLQEAPKSKKLANSRSSSQSNIPSENGGKAGSGSSRRDSDRSESQQQSAGGDTGAPRQSTDSQMSNQDPRGVSYDAFGTPRPAWHEKPISRKEIPTTSSRPVNGKSTAGQGQTATQTLEETAPGQETFMQPRAPPQRPTQTPVKDPSEQPQQEGPSPKLPRWSSGGDFTLDEDMARILGTDEGSTSILRRVSNAVRHGRTNSTEYSAPMHQPRGNHTRSISEQTRTTNSPRWPKTPTVEENGQAQDISSPISVSGGVAQDDPAFLKRQLRTSEQKVAELERQFTTEKDLKNLNKKLIEKRKTVSVLDTQTEIMIRQLEVLAGYVERAKETKQAVDPRDLEDSAIKEFVQKLDKVKQSMTTQIEQLHAERDELIEEKNQAAADRERALLEFEQLSIKNAQLLDMNNDLTQQIQGRFKSNADIKSPQGLGIYHTHKGPSDSSVTLGGSSVQTGHATLVGTDGEDPIVEHGPTVVNIRKGQVRKFNWKKGGNKVAQGLSKGVNRAVGAFQQQPHERDQHRNPQFQGLTGDSIGLPYNMTVASVESPVAVSHGLNGQNRMVSDAARQQPGSGSGSGFGFFSKKNQMPNMPKSATTMNMSSTPTVTEPPNVLFGSDLVERSDYERRQIPSVVTRCIEEVELRGMDIEGIYRKTGGNSQVKMIQEGFDKQDDFDISDPGLDITAVTSVLKQYFRKLPTPLLTFEVYDRILESNSITPDSERCAFLRRTVNSLPQKHRDCLEFLIFHLARVASREKENLMSPKNLAVVFAPTIMRDTSLEKEMTDMHAKNIAVQFILDHSDEIFAES